MGWVVASIVTALILGKDVIVANSPNVTRQTCSDLGHELPWPVNVA